MCICQFYKHLGEAAKLYVKVKKSLETVEKLLF